MTKKKTIVIIPARMGASRFPGKPLAKILDLPMIEHVRRRVLLSEAVDDVYVATCDQEIKETVEKYGGKSIMTAGTHERCTERCEEAARSLDGDIFVIAQGDEPLFMPEIITQIVEPIKSDSQVKCVSLISKIKDRRDLRNIDIVKAVIDRKHDVMYFSRSPLPYYQVDNQAPCYRQTGVSAFSANFLKRFAELEPTPLEIAESIDFLRILEHGYKIRAAVIGQATIGVDRKEHIKLIADSINHDPVQNKLYKRIMKR